MSEQKLFGKLTQFKGIRNIDDEFNKWYVAFFVVDRYMLIFMTYLITYFSFGAIDVHIQ